MPPKWLDPFIYPEVFYLLPSYIYARVKSVLLWNIVVIYGLVPPIILILLDSIHRLTGLVGPELYSTLQPLSHRRDVVSISLFYRYFHGKWSTQLHSLVPPLHGFRRQTRYSNDNPSSFKSQNLTTNFTKLALFPAQQNFGTPYHQRLSPMNISSINLKVMQISFFLP